MSTVSNVPFVEGWKAQRDRFANIPSTIPVVHPGCRGEETTAPESEQLVDTIAGMGFEQLSDEMLVENHRAAADPRLSRQYVDELFRRNHLKIARWCYRFTRDRDSAADLAQEVCTKAYRNLASFQNQSKFSTWLFSIARNHCVNALRSRASQPQQDGDEELLNLLPDRSSDDPESALSRQYDGKLVREFLNETLDDTEKAVFTLHFGEDLSLDQITSVLALENASGAKAYIVSAKRKLARAVDRWKARNARPAR